MLRIGKLTSGGDQQLIRVKNLSAGGADGDRRQSPQVGDMSTIELSSQKIPATVVWIRDDWPASSSTRTSTSASCSPAASRATASGHARRGWKSRARRRSRSAKLYYTVDVHDVSLGGMKVEPIEEYCVGKQVIVVVESLKPIKGEVRWYSDRKAGIVFDKPLEFDELAEWVGKRLELASLKASYKNS